MVGTLRFAHPTKFTQGRCYACKKGAEARRFNRLLIDAGMIKGL